MSQQVEAKVAALVARTRELAAENERLTRENSELAMSAIHDPLTGALSRSAFSEQLSRALSRLGRRPHPLAVLFIDVDRLKQINDCYGHAAGDALLRQIVLRLRASLRPSDAVARIGGDEFVILLDDLTTDTEAEIVAGRIIERAAAPCVLDSNVVHPSISVGVALASAEPSDAETLLSHADAAMYKAKSAGRGRYAMFDAAAYTAAHARLKLQKELKTAIARGQFDLHFQPIIDLSTGATVAAEALLRWNHPRLGLLTAEKFIDLAEECGLLAELTPWVVDRACRQLAAWDESLKQHAPGQMFFNLSARELTRTGLAAAVSQALTAAGVAPQRLVIEITESAMLDKPVAVTEEVNRLRALGCRLAIDDFGTGYSTLGRLVDLPADVLKIDRTFTAQLRDRPEAIAVVAAILLLAHNLKKSVVAEGVEDQAALNILTELGCEHAQGFHLNRPQPADTLEATLKLATSPVARTSPKS